MPRYKPSDCHALMLPVVLCEQIVPGTRVRHQIVVFDDFPRRVVDDNYLGRRVASGINVTER